jgi:hypothetical protein
MSLSALRQICVALGLHQGLYFLDLYARMERQIFRDGEPSPYFLHGGPLRGIPQGCPFAVIFANLFATYWILCCTMAGVTFLAYLDDWLVICNTWADMAHAWGTTAEV